MIEFTLDQTSFTVWRIIVHEYAFSMLAIVLHDFRSECVIDVITVSKRLEI